MTFENNFENKSVLVTGAGKGIGNAVARRLAASGALVYAVSRTEKDLELLRSDFPANVTTICVDLNDWDAVQWKLGQLGPMDVVLNIAGVGTPQAFLDINSETFDDIMKINLKSVVAVSQVTTKAMIANGKRGTIVNMSSRMAKKAFQDFAIYSASKAALDSLTRTMALELGPYGIRVNSINLGAVWTRMWADSFEESAQGQAELKEFITATSRRMPLERHLCRWMMWSTRSYSLPRVKRPCSLEKTSHLMEDSALRRTLLHRNQHGIMPLLFVHFGTNRQI